MHAPTPAVKQQVGFEPGQSEFAWHAQRLLPLHRPLLHWGLDVQAWLYTSKQAVPATLHTVVLGEAQPVVVPAVHVVAHAVAPAQPSPPPQAVAVAGVQVPAPSQVPEFASVNIPLLHVAAPQPVVDVG